VCLCFFLKFFKLDIILFAILFIGGVVRATHLTNHLQEDVAREGIFEKKEINIVLRATI